MAGHSTGGRSSLQCAQDSISQEYNIGAAVGYNPDPMYEECTRNNLTPLAIFTGTNDTIEPYQSGKKDFDASPV